MSFIYSQALVAAFSAANCSGIDASAPSSGNPTLNPSLWHDRTMEVSRHSRYGMTCGPLTDDHGEALLMWWLAGFPAKTSALPGKVWESPVSDPGCGPTWRASLAKFDHDTCSWKTAQLSLLGDSELSSVTWPRSGMTADGQCWELPTLERRTSETVFGFLVPTPISNDALKRGDFNPIRSWGLAGFAKLFPTPVANGLDGGSHSRAACQKAGMEVPNAGQLNPNWVEWLMGWPIGWTALKPLETAKSQPALQPRGECLEGLEAV